MHDFHLNNVVLPRNTSKFKDQTGKLLNIFVYRKQYYIICDRWPKWTSISVLCLVNRLKDEIENLLYLTLIIHVHVPMFEFVSIIIKDNI